MVSKSFRAVLVLAALIFIMLSASASARSDVNGDGWSDIVGLYNYGNALTGAWVITSDGTGATPGLAWAGAPGNWDWNRSSVVTGKFNNDTLADQVVLYNYGNASTGAWLFRSDGALFTPSLVWSSGAGNWDWRRSKIAAGDFNHDGLDELYVFYNYGNASSGLWIFQSNGTTFTPTLVWTSGPGNWDWNRSKIAVTDFDKNGYDDLAILYDYGNSSTRVWVMKSNGALVTTNIAWSSGQGNWDWNRSCLVAGDFTGDANGDVGVLYRYDNSAVGLWFLESNATTVTPDLAWSSGQGNWDWSRSKITAGNFTGDSRDDVAILYDYGGSSTKIWYLRSNGATATPAIAWSSNPGSWDWRSTKLANSGDDCAGVEPVNILIGYSVLGRPIMATRIGNGSRRYLFIGVHHGDEPQGGRVLELFRDYLVAHPEAVPMGAEVWILPYLNPDGLASGTRWNARGVNLNRNYWTNDWGLYDVTSMSILEMSGLAPMSDMSATLTGSPYTFSFAGAGPFSEPETVAVANLCMSTSFRAMISIHDSEGRVYWGQTGADLAYLFGSRAGLPVVGPLSISGDATRWFGQATGGPAITVEMTGAQADANPAAIFNAYLPAFLATLNY